MAGFTKEDKDAAARLWAAMGQHPAWPKQLVVVTDVDLGGGVVRKGEVLRLDAEAMAVLAWSLTDWLAETGGFELAAVDPFGKPGPIGHLYDREGRGRPVRGATFFQTLVAAAELRFSGAHV